VISFLEAQNIVLAHIKQLPCEQKPLAAARNCFLAEDIRAPFPVPRFDHSAVDGFAIRSTDVAFATADKPVSLNIIGTVKTGSPATTSVKQGCAIRIFTEAMLPPDADTVVMVEDVLQNNNVIQFSSPLKTNKNIRHTGEEFAKDSICLPVACKLSPAAIGLAATLGVSQVQVYQKPRVAIIVTGSELVEPGSLLGETQIYDSNRFALVAALAELGIEHVSTYTCHDDEAVIRQCLEQALSNSDVVITSGGASVGDVDYVKPAIHGVDGTIHFDKVAIKPGKPTVFATVASKPVFGLPGNPVSALVTYLLFVKPALLKMYGDVSAPNTMHEATLNGTISKRSSRTEFVRARSSQNGGQETVTPCRGQESHMLGGLVTANTLIVFDGEPRTLPDRSQVQVLPINWS